MSSIPKHHTRANQPPAPSSLPSPNQKFLKQTSHGLCSISTPSSIHFTAIPLTAINEHSRQHRKLQPVPKAAPLLASNLSIREEALSSPRRCNSTPLPSFHAPPHPLCPAISKP
ncbi:hypothetical protein M0R45_026318 [Rubus argutus]|uniref:Uncharacterized protein n=1 Tax=Rubus argutus TaxID=59490 RepID=A0AAW1WX56_RUBAR